MSATIVQAQYEQLEQLAARFEAAAEQQQALLERVSRQVDVLRGGSWQGRGVAAFLREIDGEVSPAELRLITALRKTAVTVQQICLVIRQAEDDARHPFQSDQCENQFDTQPIAPDTELISPQYENGVAISHPVVSRPVEDTIKLLDDLLTPIDWISKSPEAAEKFTQILEDFGRLLNDIEGTRGNIKQMRELGEFLKDAEKGIGFLSNIVDLKDIIDPKN